MIKCQRR